MPNYSLAACPCLQSDRGSRRSWQFQLQDSTEPKEPADTVPYALTARTTWKLTFVRAWLAARRRPAPTGQSPTPGRGLLHGRRRDWMKREKTHVELLGDGVLLVPRRGYGDPGLRPLPEPRERVVRRQPRVAVERQVPRLPHSPRRGAAATRHSCQCRRRQQSIQWQWLRAYVPWSAGRRERRGCSAAARCRRPHTSRSAARRRSSGPARTSRPPSGPTPPPPRRAARGSTASASRGRIRRRGRAGEDAPPAHPCPRPPSPRFLVFSSRRRPLL